MERKKAKKLGSARLVLLGFLGIILLGSLLLSLPVSSKSGIAVPFIDSLFTATTATCVTGLVTVPTAETWSLFGQIVILILIQTGGLGVVTVAAGFMLLISKKFSISDRIIIQDSFNLNSASGMVKFIKKVIAGCFVVELAGALLYMLVFVPEFGIKGIWISVFTSVSAFCNAGIDIIGTDSLCDYKLNPLINITTMLLIFLGSIGFVVWWDVIEILKNKKRRGFKFLSLHSKIALVGSFSLIGVGALLFFIFEVNNPDTIGNYSISEGILMSLFQSVTTRTAGFATIPQQNLTLPSTIVSLVLMFIGGSPVGTAGGVKTVTVLVIGLTVISILKNKKTVDVFGRQISEEVIRKSVAVFMLSLTVVLASTVLLSVFESGELSEILYETVSATATVGLTRNFTPRLDTIGRLIITATMYFGRVGPISLVIAFNMNKQKGNVIENPVEKISVG